MSKTDDIRNALACRPGARVPLWELEFHAWDAASRRRVVLGREFERLSAVDREIALQRNAEIILSVSEEIGFAAVTCPGSYWEQAPGELGMSSEQGNQPSPEGTKAS